MLENRWLLCWKTGGYVGKRAVEFKLENGWCWKMGDYVRK